MKRARPPLFVYWAKDINGEWMLHVDESKVRLKKERAVDADLGYPVTPIATYRCARSLTP